MNTLNIIAYILSGVLLFFIFRTFNWAMLKMFWNNAKIKVEHKKQTAKGLKMFLYEKGKTIIYAKTQPQADYKFKEYKKQRTANAKSTLKKV